MSLKHKGKRAGLLILLASCASPLMAKDQVIHAGRIIDGIDGNIRDRVSILVKDDRITQIVNGFVDANGAEVIDLSGMTVLPGFIESHDHLSNTGDRRPINRFVLTDGDAVINAVVNARIQISTGFTSTRDLGSGPLTAPALKRAIESGKVVGPRLWSSMEQIGPTGGHSDPANGMRPDIHFDNRPNSIADGVDEMVRRVRSHHRRGADLIKIYPSGGVTSIGDDPQAMLMTEAEMRAAVQTAHALGMKVAAHAHGTDAINAAIKAGVDSIEHGSFSNDESFKLMKEHGTYLVPTLLVADVVHEQAVNRPETLPPTVADKAKAVVPVMVETLRRAYRAGVRIAFGTDQGAGGNRNKAEEFALMVKAGLTPRDAILTYTQGAANLLGAANDIGTIAPNRFADIVAVKGNPLDDITVLQNVEFVMKGGTVFKSNGKMVQ